MAELEGKLVSTKQQYKSGDDKTMEFELTNRGEEDVHVLDMVHAAGGALERLPGGHARRPARALRWPPGEARVNRPRRTTSRSLQGKPSLKVSTLHRAYDVSVPGQYDVALDTEVQDYVTAEDEAPLNTKLEKSERVTPKQALRGGETQFVVLPDGGHLPTEGEEARKSEKSKKADNAGSAGAQKKAGALPRRLTAAPPPSRTRLDWPMLKAIT